MSKLLGMYTVAGIGAHLRSAAPLRHGGQTGDAALPRLKPVGSHHIYRACPQMRGALVQALSESSGCQEWCSSLHALLPEPLSSDFCPCAFAGRIRLLRTWGLSPSCLCLLETTHREGTCLRLHSHTKPVICAVNMHFFGLSFPSAFGGSIGVLPDFVKNFPHRQRACI